MKKTALVLIPVLIIFVLGGFFFFKSRSTPPGSPLPTATPTSGFTAPEAREKGVEVSLIPRYDNKAVILKVDKLPSDVTSVEYELSYEAKGGLPRGVLGKIDVKSAKETILREILLGTCSRNICVYDEGVKKVSLVLKFNKSSGQSTIFSQEYEI